jgi:plastocyanin
MTYPSLICFSLGCWVACAATLEVQLQLTDARGRQRSDLSGVVVWLEPASGNAPSAAPGNFVLDQRGKKFIPHVLAVPTGSTVRLPNNDPIFHNAFSTGSSRAFDTGLYSPGTSRSVVLSRPGIARVFCNIHSSMSAVIAVLPTPWFAVSALNGRLTLSNVPDGEYRLRIWHERSTEEELRRLERSLTMRGDGELRLQISEAGYVVVPHRNKFGQAYPPEPPDQIYRGRR